MKVIIGVVGPIDTVNMIASIFNEFEEHAELEKFIYKDSNEVSKIIEVNQHISVWMFSGQVPYSIAKEINPDINGFHPQLNGSSLAKVLLDISYKNNKRLEKISFDTIPSTEVIEMFEELELSTNQLKLFPYSGHKSKTELFNHHKTLFDNGKVEVCVTGIHEIYDKLNSLEVPTYRIIPSKLSIRNTFNRAIQTGDMLQLKDSQIAILNIKILNYNELIKKEKDSLARKRINLMVERLVIDYTETVSGSYIQQSEHKYTIFSTRGTINVKQTEKLFHLLEGIKNVTALSANIGIGYGDSVFNAEQNADIALDYTSEYGKEVIMITDTNGKIKGPLENKREIEFKTYTQDPLVLKKLDASGISISTYNKVHAVQRSLHKGFINTNDLSDALNMTQRNARRILTSLEKNNLAKIIGEEMTGSRGRPGKLYKIVM